jgi:retron-type reverse transcriptase
MRRAGNLIDRIANPDNVRLAYLKACKGKRATAECREFTAHLDDELERLSCELAAGKVDWGAYRRFEVQDPKARVIHAPAFRARVGHHALINICEPVFEAYQVFDSYACRRGKGLDAALERTRTFMACGGWYLKLDVRKYFDTIHHETLKALLRRRFKDRIVLRHFAEIIDGHESSPGRGVPIGNLTSQHFSNFYLAPLDHHIKEVLRVGRYVRYMDDFVLWHAERDALALFRQQVDEFLGERLQLEFKPAVLQPCGAGLTFLGYRIFPHRVGLSPRSRHRFLRKGHAYQAMLDAGLWDDRETARHMAPLLAFIRRGASRQFRERFLHEIGRLPEARTA